MVAVETGRAASLLPQHPSTSNPTSLDVQALLEQERTRWEAERAAEREAEKEALRRELLRAQAEDREKLTVEWQHASLSQHASHAEEVESLQGQVQQLLTLHQESSTEASQTLQRLEAEKRAQQEELHAQ